eukprot:1175630-Prorocentrum_minimum.AAC.1
MARLREEVAAGAAQLDLVSPVTVQSQYRHSTRNDHNRDPLVLTLTMQQINMGPRSVQIHTQLYSRQQLAQWYSADGTDSTDSTERAAGGVQARATEGTERAKAAERTKAAEANAETEAALLRAHLAEAASQHAAEQERRQLAERQLAAVGAELECARAAVSGAERAAAEREAAAEVLRLYYDCTLWRCQSSTENIHLT